VETKTIRKHDRVLQTELVCRIECQNSRQTKHFNEISMLFLRTLFSWAPALNRD